MKKKSLILISLILSTLYVFAATYTFDNTGGGNTWSTLTNWKVLGVAPATLPGAGDDVILIQSVGVDINASVASVTYNADWAVLNINAGIDLTVSGAISGANTGLQLNVLSATSTLSANSLSLTNITFINNGTVTVGAGGASFTNGSFANYKTFSSGGSVLIDGTTFLNNNSCALTSGNFTMTGNITSNSNAGTIDAQAVLIDNTGVGMTNSGTIYAHGGIDVSGSGINSCVNGGSVNYWGTLDESGTCKLTGNTTLPIELTSFFADQVGGAVELQWETASEENSAYFRIEHSINGTQFGKIGEVEAAGYSSTLQRYNFSHAHPDFGLNYYRLKEVDHDGASQFSDIISIHVLGEESVLESTIVKRGDVIFLTGVENIQSLQYSSVNGLTTQIPVSGKRVAINTENLHAGTYFLTINHGFFVQNTTFIVTE